MCRTACTEPQCLYNGALNFTYTYISPLCRTACTEPHCLYNGALYLYLYFYSTSVPYGLYRTSMPVQRFTLTLPILLSPYVPYGLYRTSGSVQRCTLPLPIPLLPLCAVRPVQSLSAYTTVHLTLPIPTLHLCAVLPVQSLSACTKLHFNFTYTSTPPMCRTACTEPQCLYNGALYLYLYLYSPYLPYGMYRASVPVQRCTLPLPILLLSLCPVRPVQNLSTCTTVHFTFTYTSTPPMCRTASTGALYLFYTFGLRFVS